MLCNVGCFVIVRLQGHALHLMKSCDSFLVMLFALTFALIHAIALARLALFHLALSDLPLPLPVPGLPLPQLSVPDHPLDLLCWLLCSALFWQSLAVCPLEHLVTLKLVVLTPLPTSPSVSVLCSFVLSQKSVPVCCARSVVQQMITNDPVSRSLMTDPMLINYGQCLFGFVLPGCDSSLKISHCIHEVTIEWDKPGSYFSNGSSR